MADEQDYFEEQPEDEGATEAAGSGDVVPEAAAHAEAAAEEAAPKNWYHSYLFGVRE